MVGGLRPWGRWSAGTPSGRSPRAATTPARTPARARRTDWSWNALSLGSLDAGGALDSPGPVFFRQRRYGLDGREILVWKFRSMVPDADKLVDTLFEESNEGNAVQFKMTAPDGTSVLNRDVIGRRCEQVETPPREHPLPDPRFLGHQSFSATAAQASPGRRRAAWIAGHASRCAVVDLPPLPPKRYTSVGQTWRLYAIFTIPCLRWSRTLPGKCIRAGRAASVQNATNRRSTESRLPDRSPAINDAV